MSLTQRDISLEIAERSTAYTEARRTNHHPARDYAPYRRFVSSRVPIPPDLSRTAESPFVKPA